MLVMRLAAALPALSLSSETCWSLETLASISLSSSRMSPEGMSLAAELFWTVSLRDLDTLCSDSCSLLGRITLLSLMSRGLLAAGDNIVVVEW